MAPRKPARSRKTALQPIFSWIHLSDVHVGQGSAADQWDQKGMLREVIRDLKKNARMFPQSDAVLVTGDIAFSGDSLRTGETSSRQYTDAAEWLRALGVAVGLEPDRIFVIPGNHDIQRTKKEERQQMRLLRALQNGEDPLDDALRDQTDRMMLTARLGNYLAFARDFAPICLSPTTRPEQWLYWTHALAAGDQYIVRLFGLNSALLCNGDDDARRLFLNKQQLHLLATSDGQPEEIRIVLSHHPFKSDWLRNSDDARDALRGRAHVVLTGHEHQPNVRLVIEPGTKGIIEVFAGAVDPGPDETREYTYNVSTLYAGPADSVRIRIWPRRWLRSAQAYREDWSLVSQGAPFYEQTLPEPIRR
ncbi:MAG TPA: metallophosphoesterase, partial [Thermoanaerobaculia bacterium]|nr:metallophosphoesterase [Thermoanaerobaculia bacterium]